MKDVHLETERLLLRQWRLDDFETYEKMCADEEIMRYIGGKTLHRIEAAKLSVSRISSYPISSDSYRNITYKNLPQD